jgi:hypothetical protein
VSIWVGKSRRSCKLPASRFRLEPTIYLPTRRPSRSATGASTSPSSTSATSATGGVPQPSPVPWTGATLLLAIDEAHFGTPGGLEPPPNGLSLARRYLVVGGRAYVLRTALGTEATTAGPLAEANRVVSTLSLGGWRPTECPPNWPGPWTACPEADWVRRVAEGAGYRVVGDTGSSLVARGGGRSFSIWATKLAGKELSATARREKWRRLGVVEGTGVFGDEESWRWWPAQGFVFWLSAGRAQTQRLLS